MKSEQWTAIIISTSLLWNKKGLQGRYKNQLRNYNYELQIKNNVILSETKNLFNSSIVINEIFHYVQDDKR